MCEQLGLASDVRKNRDISHPLWNDDIFLGISLMHFSLSGLSDDTEVCLRGKEGDIFYSQSRRIACPWDPLQLKDQWAMCWLQSYS